MYAMPNPMPPHMTLWTHYPALYAPVPPLCSLLSPFQCTECTTPIPPYPYYDGLSIPINEPMVIVAQSKLLYMLLISTTANHIVII